MRLLDIDKNRLIEFAIRELTSRLTPEQIEQVDKVTAAGAQLANQLGRIELTQIEMYKRQDIIMARLDRIENALGIDRSRLTGMAGTLQSNGAAGEHAASVVGIPLAADTGVTGTGRGNIVND